jgi:hypothetical protein
MHRCIRLSGLRRWVFALVFWIAGAMSMASVQAQELCGGVDYPFPYTDVSGVGAAFCPGIMEAYVTGLSRGTTPTTFSPNESVPRLQMTTFLQRALDQGVARAGRRGALDQWWAPQIAGSTQMIALGPVNSCIADGESIWVTTDMTKEFLSRVEASTGALVTTFLDAAEPLQVSVGVRVAAGRVFVARSTSPGTLYSIETVLTKF